jgi:hypothetical protein
LRLDALEPPHLGPPSPTPIDSGEARFPNPQPKREEEWIKSSKYPPNPTFVMAGFDPAIHVFLSSPA